MEGAVSHLGPQIAGYSFIEYSSKINTVFIISHLGGNQTEPRILTDSAADVGWSFLQDWMNTMKDHGTVITLISPFLSNAKSFSQ